MTTASPPAAFEAAGCRALARLGGRMTFVYGVATGLGLLAGAGVRGVPEALEILLLAGLAVPAVGCAGMLSRGLRSRGPDLTPWTPRSGAVRRLVPLGLVAVALTCGVLVLDRVCVLAPVLGWPRVHLLAGWAIPGFGLGLALAAGPLWGVLSFAVLVSGFRLLVTADGARAVPGTAAGAAVTVLVGIVIHVAARQGFRATEAAARAAEDAELARLGAEQRLLARRRTDRTLHDTVLATLTLLAHAGVGVPADQVRTACRRDLAVLRGSGGGPGAATPVPPALVRAAAGRGGVAAALAGVTAGPDGPAGPDVLAGPLDQVRALAARHGIDLRVHVQQDPAGGAPAGPIAVRRAGPEPRVVEAWSGALGECVANIAQHAQVRAADVVLGLTDDALVTVVVDEGVGFEPGAVAPERLGLAGSVRERLAEVGGAVRIWSRPGQGTVVELLLPWPRARERG